MVLFSGFGAFLSFEKGHDYRYAITAFVGASYVSLEFF
jgi:hypothetical protein